ncbi:MAG TPA: biotin/lipoyl-binding protein, partial [Candidatus Binatia bacterium]|nr:biotin/lipoyl-binding protein [Candidatus Binatia bacterium]
FLQIRKMVEHGKKAVLPPDTVTTATARSDSWETSLSAVGSLTAVQGVTVAAELPGKVVELSFEPGAKVKRGDPLIRQDTSVEEAQLPGVEAQVTLTESVLARDVEMLKEKIVSQADYDVPSPLTGRRWPRCRSSAPPSPRRRSAHPSAAAWASGR